MTFSTKDQWKATRNFPFHNFLLTKSLIEILRKNVRKINSLNHGRK